MATSTASLAVPSCALTRRNSQCWPGQPQFRTPARSIPGFPSETHQKHCSSRSNPNADASWAWRRSQRGLLARPVASLSQGASGGLPSDDSNENGAGPLERLGFGSGSGSGGDSSAKDLDGWGAALVQQARAAELLARLSRSTREGEARAAADAIVMMIPPESRKPLLQALFAVGEDSQSVLFSMADMNDDGVLDKREFAQFLEATRAANADDAALRPLNTGELAQIFWRAAVGNVGFGIVDNMIMIAAGDVIEGSIGRAFGFSTLLSAGLGNTFSDIIGTLCKEYIETASDAVMPELYVSSFQMASRPARYAEMAGSCFGITTGCLIGLTPLFFGSRWRADRGGDEGAAAGGTSSTGGSLSTPPEEAMGGRGRTPTMAKALPQRALRDSQQGGEWAPLAVAMVEREGSAGTLEEPEVRVLLAKFTSTATAVELSPIPSTREIQPENLVGFLSSRQANSSASTSTREGLTQVASVGVSALPVPATKPSLAAPPRDMMIPFLVVSSFMALRRMWRCIKGDRRSQWPPLKRSS